YFTQEGLLASGSSAVVSRYRSLNDNWTELQVPNYKTTADILATTFFGDVYFVTGTPNPAPAADDILSTIRACPKGTFPAFGSCGQMALIDNPVSCVQTAAELRGAYAAAANLVFFVGYEPTPAGLGNVVIAAWDGNDLKECGGIEFKGAAFYDNGPYDLKVPVEKLGPAGLNDVHGIGNADVWAVGDRATVYHFTGPVAGWQQIFPEIDLPADSGFGISNDILSVWVDPESGVHMVGVKYTETPNCKIPFYLHAVMTGAGTYEFNNYMEFTAYETCDPNLDRTSLEDVVVDPDSGNVYAFGWAWSQGPGGQDMSLGLVMRITRPAP
ncbi:MAG: hypothetical protein GXP54_01835, partial [Deltaproteobacteria bacterium]|nr:hypothetical protein [Deltaproteobacteria bacterium]